MKSHISYSTDAIRSADTAINIKSKEEPGCSEDPTETEPNRRGFAKA